MRQEHWVNLRQSYKTINLRHKFEIDNQLQNSYLVTFNWKSRYTREISYKQGKVSNDADTLVRIKINHFNDQNLSSPYFVVTTNKNNYINERTNISRGRTFPNFIYNRLQFNKIFERTIAG